MSLYTIKRLIFVLLFAVAVFHFAKPIVLQFTSSEDYSRRRRVFLVLTVVSFLSPSFWLYALVAAPTLLWAGRKDSNPIALYLLLLHVVPPFGFPIQILGKAGLFDLDNFKLLAFFVLLPATMRHRKTREKGESARFIGMDALLLAFGALQVALYTSPDFPVPIPDSPTNALRRAVLFYLDTYLVYFAVSRLCQSRARLVEAAAAFCLACGIMAAIAVFENMRHWLLYLEVIGNWGIPLSATMWLTRGAELRAQASAGHALALGYVLAVGFGLWLYLKSQVQGRMQRFGVTLVLWGGLFGAFSRGPWLGALTAYFTFFAAGPRAVSGLAKGGFAALAVGLVILVSPIGDRILEILPVMGKTEDGSILYRQRLAERGWQIVWEHPLLGDQFPWPEMADLRQGEGIIDIVNTYLGVALNYGFIGLFLFVSFILLGVLKVYARTRALAVSNPDFALFGTSLIGCIVAELLMIDTMSFNLGIYKTFYVLAGFTAAYAALKLSPPAPAPAPVRATPSVQQ